MTARQLTCCAACMGPLTRAMEHPASFPRLLISLFCRTLCDCPDEGVHHHHDGGCNIWHQQLMALRMPVCFREIRCGSGMPWLATCPQTFLAEGARTPHYIC